MKLRLLAVLTVAVFAAAGCASSSRPPAAPAPGVQSPPTATAVSNGLRITVTARAATFDAQAPLAVDAQVINESKDPVPYVRSTGCDRGIRLDLMDQSGWRGWFREDVPPQNCTEAIAISTLKPGETISAHYVWDRVPDEPPLSGGEYTVRAAFNRGDHYQAITPVVAELKVQVTGASR